jgi:2-aminoadipate transaminase
MTYQFAKRTQQMRRNKLRENAKRNLAGGDNISFAYGYPPTEAFPIATIQTISDEMFAHTDPQRYMQYGPAEGLPALREQLSQRLQTVTKIPQAAKEPVLITSGSTQAFDLAVRTFCDAGDMVLCEAQTFMGAVNNIKSYGAKPVAVPMDMDAQSMDLDVVAHLLDEDRAHRIKMIYVIPTFQNPLGTSMPLSARKRLYALAKAHGTMIFEDDPYGELRYEGAPIPPLKSLDEDGIVLYAGSFSKILAPGTRLGFILAPDAVMEKLVLNKQCADSFSNYYWQHIVVGFMKDHDFEGHVADLIKLYRRKRDLMERYLDQIDAGLMTYIKPEGGYFLNCHLADTVDPERFYQVLAAKHVSVIPGDIMCVAGVGYEHDFRLNFTMPALADIPVGITAIQDAITSASVKLDHIAG